MKKIGRIQNWLLTCDEQDKNLEISVLGSPCGHLTPNETNTHIVCLFDLGFRLNKQYLPCGLRGGRLAAKAANSASWRSSSAITASGSTKRLSSPFLTVSLTSTAFCCWTKAISWSESSQTITERKWQATSCQTTPSL